jgi:hypothetical protein
MVHISVLASEHTTRRELLDRVLRTLLPPDVSRSHLPEITADVRRAARMFYPRRRSSGM